MTRANAHHHARLPPNGEYRAGGHCPHARPGWPTRGAPPAEHCNAVPLLTYSGGPLSTLKASDCPTALATWRVSTGGARSQDGAGGGGGVDQPDRQVRKRGGAVEGGRGGARVRQPRQRALAAGQVRAGAAGGALASGIIGRSVVIGKVLSVMF